MRGSFCAALLALAGCGRLWFDPLSDAADSARVHAYVLGSAPDTVGILDVGPDGELAEAASSPFLLGAGLENLTSDAAGNRLYVAARDGTIRTLAIDRDSGALTPLDVDTVGIAPENIVIHPNGQWLYVSNWDFPAGGLVYGFEIAADGTLTAIAGSPWSHPGPDTTWVEVDPLGRWLYAASDDNMLYGFAISTTTGALSLLPTTPWNSGSGGPWVILIEGTGRFGFVAPDLTGGIPGFTIDAMTGALTTTPGSQFGTASVAFNAAMNRDRTLMFIANQGLGSLTFSAYFVDQVAGALFELAGSPTDPGGHRAITVTTSPVTDDLYVGGAGNMFASIVHYRATTAGLEYVRMYPLPGVVNDGRMAIVRTR